MHGELRIRTFSREGALKLDAPFCLCAVHLEHGDSHDEDDEGGDELEDTCERRVV